MYKIFIVEDDRGIASSLESYLKGWGFDTRCARDLANVAGEFERYDPQLVLLDISLPFYNGFYWCSQIRQSSKAPIVFISSASDNMNIVTAMNMGGDDFIAKPFDLSVLVAKINALLRRSYDFAGFQAVLRCRGAVLDTDSAALVYGGERIDLTKNEYRILQTLLEKKGRVVSREHLMNRLWETDSYVDENTLTVNVGRLRKKLDNAGLEGFITTKVGMGYMIEEK
ncbi:MAG: response regulator transcription factor [Ruminococcus sp.]|nr:response regulator transcription factor [Ruminococcus sp.]